MSAGLEIRDLVVRYAGHKVPALDGVALDLGPTDLVGVTGRTGSGKSTLALVAAGLLPRVIRANVSGSVTVDGQDALHATAAQLAGRVGIVFSAPALQLSASKPTVREELAFGLENLAVPRADMDERIDAALARLGIAHLAERDPLTLSGGEQQRVAIASIVVMGTDVLVLDEPAAQLDPAGTESVAAMLAEMTADGRAVLVAEHAPQVLLETRRCLVLDSGRVIADTSPADALRADRAAGHETGDEPGLGPSIRSVRPVGVAVHDLTHRYPGGIEAVRGVSLSVAPGETVAIVGQNGSGKTTLAKHLNGLLRPDSGQVTIDGHDIAERAVNQLAGLVGFVFQNPDDQLFNNSVEKEVGFGPRNLRLDPASVSQLVDGALGMTGLSAHRATNPYDLDISIRKLVALAGVLAMEPPVLVMDEPTMAQDPGGTRRIGSIVDAWHGAGRTVIAITHDMDFAARHFERIVVMRDGATILDGPPASVFAAANSALLSSTGLRAPLSDNFQLDR